MVRSRVRVMVRVRVRVRVRGRVSLDEQVIHEVLHLLHRGGVQVALVGILQ